LRVSVIIPVYRDAQALARTLEATDFGDAEVIVAAAEGDSSLTALRASRPDVAWVIALRGRASQMNAGASIAKGDWFLFLHADTRLPANADQLILNGLGAAGLEWGRFDVRIEGASRWLQLVASFMNVRSRITGIATGDQAMFVTRRAFDALRGFPDQALMEDVELSSRLKRRGPPLCLRSPVVTSGRRWNARGVARTILLMWWIRLLYVFGVAPDRLARMYH